MHGSKYNCKNDTLFLSAKSKMAMRELTLDRKSPDALVAHSDWCEEMAHSFSGANRKFFQDRADMFLEYVDSL